MRISDWSSDVCSSDLRRAPAGDAIPLDIAQMRTRGGHSLCADADQARLHHRAPRAHAAEPIAAGKKTSHAGPTADPAAVEPTAPDRPFLGRADRRANDAAKVASRALSALLALPTEPWRELVVVAHRGPPLWSRISRIRA